MSNAIETAAGAIDAVADTITKLRESLAALEALAYAGSDLSAIDAAEVKARALDALRAVELREEQAADSHADYVERRAAREAEDANRAAHAAYLTAHLALERETRDALRAILAEVARRS